MKWNEVKIFISSTFNDMHAERDYLITEAFPELNEWCEKRRIRLSDIDLRWGVTKEDSESGNTIKACLDCIDECRPFFLCFLGQRRGWVPDLNSGIDESTFEKYKGLKDKIGSYSITEMEIEHAALTPLYYVADKYSDDDQKKYALFFFRNNPFSGGLFRNNILSDDQKKVYYKFPCTPWIYRTDRYIPKDATFENYAFIFKVRFKNIYSTNINTYIQRSKCWELSGAIKDNGRIVSADSLAITINEFDWMIIKNHYKWDSIELIDSWYSKKDYLPKELIEYILKLYGDKTSLKDVEGQEEIYMKAKQFINALFGMAVTDIVQSDIKYDDAGNWIVEFLSSETVKRKLAALSNRYHTRDRRYFMSYSWGCWVTSAARYNLWLCIDKCTHNDIPGYDVLYCDTDSIFCKGHHDFTDYNNMIVSKLEKMCKHYKIDPENTRPKNPKGKVCQLGIFDREKDISEFKCLHAKCYAYRLEEDKSLHITVAGVNKGAVDVLKNDIDNFKVGLKFNKDHAAVKKNMHTYVKDQPAVLWPDGYRSDILSGINMRPTGYKIKNNDEFEKLLEFTQNAEYEDIDEMYINKLKGWFEYGE